VIVSDHVPESPEGDGRNRYPKLRHVPFQKGLEELTPPSERIELGASRVRKGEATAQPMPGLPGRTQIIQPEAFQWDGFQPPREAL